MKTICKILLLTVIVLFTRPVKGQSVPKWKIEDLKEVIAHSEKPTIINFWATFCKPCITEIPYFQEIVKRYDSAGLQLILVSLDPPGTYGRLPDFARKFRFDPKLIRFLDESNADLFCPAVDKTWSGAIPASLFIHNKTGYRKFFEDEMTKAVFENEVQQMLSGSR